MKSEDIRNLNVMWYKNKFVGKSKGRKCPEVGISESIVYTLLSDIPTSWPLRTFDYLTNHTFWFLLHFLLSTFHYNSLHFAFWYPHFRTFALRNFCQDLHNGHCGNSQSKRPWKYWNTWTQILFKLKKKVFKKRRQEKNTIKTPNYWFQIVF